MGEGGDLDTVIDNYLNIWFYLNKIYWRYYMKFGEIIVSENLKIKELFGEEIIDSFSVISQLRTNLTLEKYKEYIKVMTFQGYKVICLFENNEIVSYAGIICLTNLYFGKHIWVYDLVTSEKRRSNGYGKLLLSYIEKWAKDNNCETIALSSGLQRERAHLFYQNIMKYDKKSYAFVKEIK
jgi:GNAT superfamily N-acetyltransferase